MELDPRDSESATLKHVRSVGHAGRTADGDFGPGPEAPAAHVESAVLGTGIPGLDEILTGGLPRERMYLVQGTPGSGKTTLALQFLLEGRSRGELGLYVTLTESSEELGAVAHSHGWSLDGMALLDSSEAPEIVNPDAQYTVFHPSEVELQDTIGRVLSRVQAVRPTRVVLDSISDMRLLARDPLRFRRQVLALKQFFTARGITVLLLDDESSGEADLQLHSLAHGVIHLDQIALSHGAERRQLRVTKLRGVSFHAGYHDFVIRTGGLAVFPRIRMGAPAPSFPRGKLQSGSAELDALLGGGLVHGASVLITGAPGTGKSVLTTQYAVAAAALGAKVALYMFDERVDTFLDRADTLGMHVAEHVESGQIALNPLEPTQVSPGEFAHRVMRAVNEGVRLVVVDSLNGFTKAMAQEEHVTLKLHELLSCLGSRGATTIMTLAQRGVFGTPPEDGADVSYLADAVILLRYFEAQGEVRRAMSVVKQRSGDHERTIREVRIGPGGLHLGAPLRDFQGVLTGVPTFSGGSTKLMENSTTDGDG